MTEMVESWILKNDSDKLMSARAEVAALFLSILKNGKKIMSMKILGLMN